MDAYKLPVPVSEGPQVSGSVGPVAGGPLPNHAATGTAEVAAFGAPVPVAAPRIYISGAITGLPIDVAREAFADAADELAALGYEPVNPMLLPAPMGCACPNATGAEGTDSGHEWACYLRKDIRAIVDCHAILMLPGWEASHGARLELTVASAIGLQVWWQVPLTGPAWYGFADDRQTCANCGDQVHTISSRLWCDGCEEEAEQAAAPVDVAEPRWGSGPLVDHNPETPADSRLREAADRAAGIGEADPVQVTPGAGSADSYCECVMCRAQRGETTGTPSADPDTHAADVTRHPLGCGCTSCADIRRSVAGTGSADPDGWVVMGRPDGPSLAS